MASTDRSPSGTNGVALDRRRGRLSAMVVVVVVVVVVVAADGCCFWSDVDVCGAGGGIHISQCAGGIAAVYPVLAACRAVAEPVLDGGMRCDCLFCSNIVLFFRPSTEKIVYPQ